LTPTSTNRRFGSWDLTFPWMLGWLSEVAEEQRDILVLTATLGESLLGILPLLIHDGAEGRELRLIGSEGCFGDSKGILGAKQDQAKLGEAFGDYLTKEYLGQLHKLNFQRVFEKNLGIRALVNNLVHNSGWSARTIAEPSARFLFRPTLGPDGGPIWSLAVRRKLKLVEKAFASGLFDFSEASEETDKQQVVKHAMMISGMHRSDAPELKHRFGSIPMAQRVMDYRFSHGVSKHLSEVGRLGACTLQLKGKPIAGALYVDYGHARHVFWIEVRVHPNQEQLIFWMLFSKMVRSALRDGIDEVQIASMLASWTIGLKNDAASVCSIEATSPTTLRDESSEISSSKHTITTA
ncbi:MAG: hypothetical protein ACOYKN_17040, partial [Pirellula sp.]